MNVLLIKDGRVENCISADSVERALMFYPDHICMEQVDGVGPSYTYADGVFTPPPPPVVEVQPITKLAFLRRFPTAKRIAIRASTDPIIVDAMALLDLAQDVIVNDPDTVMLVGYLQQQGFLTAEEAQGVLA
jgi:hypothetical protein